MSRLSGPPPGVADLVDGAVARGARASAALLSVSVLVGVPAGLLSATAPLWPTGTRTAVVAVPVALGFVLGMAGCVVVLGDRGLGQAASPFAALRRVVRRLPALLTVTAVGLGQVAVGLVVFIGPGLSRLGVLQTAWPVLLLEDVGPREALRRARFLGRGQESTALVTQATLAVLGAVVASLPAAALLLVLPGPAAGSTTLTLTRLLLLGLLLGVVGVPLLAAGQFSFFLARRERLEALDLQLALQLLDELTPDARSAA